MDALIRELNRRHKIALSHLGIEFLPCTCSYLDLLVLEKNVQDILQRQEQEKDLGSPDNIWQAYHQLYINIYEPIRIKHVVLEKHFSHFTKLSDEDRHASEARQMFLFLMPNSGKAMRQRNKYRKSLTLLHDQMVILLKNKELIPSPMDYKPTSLALALGTSPKSLWQDITIRFKEPGTNLEISYGDKSYSTTHEQLEFVSKLNGTTPKLYWTFLRAMAVNPETGVFPLHKFTGTDRRTHNRLNSF